MRRRQAVDNALCGHDHHNHTFWERALNQTIHLPEPDHLSLDSESIQRSLVNRLVYTIGKDPMTATHRDWFYAAAAVVRERMIERWMETMRSYYVDDRKRVYYFSMEFLMGRTLPWVTAAWDAWPPAF